MKKYIWLTGLVTAAGMIAACSPAANTSNTNSNMNRTNMNSANMNGNFEFKFEFEQFVDWEFYL